MSKAFAEDLMYSYRHELPISIIRPSIIVCAENEPEPGYIQGTQVKFKFNQSVLKLCLILFSTTGNDWYDSWSNIRDDKNYIDGS